MRNKGIAVLVIHTMMMLSLFCQGCNNNTETQSFDMGQNSQDTSFRKQALDELEKYRVEKDIGIQGFFLGKKLTETSIKETEIDEMSGCLKNRFDDDLFGIIDVYSDSNGVIVRIVTVKQFGSWLTAKEFYDNLKETVINKYPADPGEGGESIENFHFIEIMGTDDKEAWVESYTRSMRAALYLNKHVRPYRHYMIVHPYLYRLTFQVQVGDFNGIHCVMGDYRSRQYQHMLEAVKRKTKNEMDRALD